MKKQIPFNTGILAALSLSVCGMAPPPTQPGIGVGACCVATDPPESMSTPAAQAPNTPPAAQPAGTTVRGKVSIAAAWKLQKPDLTRVVVYLASHTTLDGAPSGVEYATVAQKNKSFVPNFTVITKGTVVEFPNWDDFDHNVFSRSKAAPAFDLDRYPKGQSKSRTFDKLGVVQVFCNIHPQMRAIIFVTPNRYFTRCDADGNFALPDVPPGSYEVVAWQERCGDTKQPLAVTAQGAQHVAFELSENRESIFANDPPKREADYGVERGLGRKREKLGLPVVEESHPARDAPK